jgi:hypothetical protein
MAGTRRRFERLELGHTSAQLALLVGQVLVTF